MEIRVLNDVRNITTSKVEVRIGESLIVIGGSLPIKGLSLPLTDRKTGERFRELIMPGAFKLAFVINKADGYKLKLLKNHDHKLEFSYNELEFKEVDEQELRFAFTLPKTERNLELLNDISEEKVTFSFGFVCESFVKEKTNEIGVDYIRKVVRFSRLLEISILDIFTKPAYPQSIGFTSLSESDAKNKIQKFVTKKSREKQAEEDKKIIDEWKAYIAKCRRNELIQELAGLRKVRY